MTLPLISCVIPVFNGERYLGEALDSALAQTHSPLEIIVVDDGSTDGTAEVVGRYAGRIEYLKQPNLGYEAAKDSGIRLARGEFIAFLDADDVWHPAKLAIQVARMRSRPELDLCFTRFRNFWMPDLAEEEQRYRRSSLAQPQASWSISTLLARRSAFERFGVFHDDRRALENMTWFLRAAQRGAVIEVLADILMDRRFNVESFTRRGQKAFFDNFLPILKEWRDYRRRTGFYIKGQ